MKNNIGRREMLKSVLAAATGLSAGKWVNFFPHKTLPVNKKSDAPMQVRPLGKTGHHVTMFSLGGGGDSDSTVNQRHLRDKAVDIVNRALDLGVNYVDTAPRYEAGDSEKNIGEVMAERRDEVFLATKTRKRNYDDVMRECEESLKRLQTDYIDLYQHHYVHSDGALNRVMADNGALEAFKKLQEEGVIRFLGITSHSSRILRNALKRYDYDCVFLTLNASGDRMDDIEYLDDFFTLATKKNVGINAMKIARRNSLFGKGITMKQSFDYTMSFPVSTVVIGMTELEQVDENVELAKNFIPLTPNEMGEIEKAANG